MTCFGKVLIETTMLHFTQMRIRQKRDMLKVSEPVTDAATLCYVLMLLCK
jgi:hypothetical protein